MAIPAMKVARDVGGGEGGDAVLQGGGGGAVGARSRWNVARSASAPCHFVTRGA